jgi:hypothetical protein
LIELFPDIGLDKSQLWHRRTFKIRFHSSLKSYVFASEMWEDRKTQRVLFEKFAAVHNFDPYNPEAWYSQSKEQIMAFKVFFKYSKFNIHASQGTKRVIAYHSHSISKTLINLFPDVAFTKDRFWSNRYVLCLVFRRIGNNTYSGIKDNISCYFIELR